MNNWQDIYPRPRHRGRRGTLQELARLPQWAKDLLALLREQPAIHRYNIIRVLRWLADFLENQWQIANPNGSSHGVAAAVESSDVPPWRAPEGEREEPPRRRQRVHIPYDTL